MFESIEEFKDISNILSRKSSKNVIQQLEQSPEGLTRLEILERLGMSAHAYTLCSKGLKKLGLLEKKLGKVFLNTSRKDEIEASVTSFLKRIGK